MKAKLFESAVRDLQIRNKIPILIMRYALFFIFSFRLMCHLNLSFQY